MNTANKNFLKNPSLPVVTAFVSFTILGMLLLYIADENFFVNFFQSDPLHLITIINIVFCINLMGRYMKSKLQQSKI